MAKRLHRLYNNRFEWLDTAIAWGVADAEAGLVQDIDEVRTELRGRFAVCAP